jgi:glycosyltransferase involved in cell wall biosynthesis
VEDLIKESKGTTLRILTINYEFPPLGGGASPICFHLARELVRKGHEVDVVTMHFRGLERSEVIDGVGVYRVPCLRKTESVCQTYEMVSFAISAVPVAIRLAKKKRYDLNHTHFIFPSALTSYVVKKVTGLPYVVTAHGSDVPGYNPDRFQIEHKLFKPLWTKLARNANALTSPSESLRSLILSHDDKRPVEVVPNAIDTSLFLPGPKERRILMVSRLLPRKGFQYVLEALAGIESDFEVVIVGDGPFKPDLEALVRQKNLNVRFTGWLDNTSEELRALYATSAIFALPSQMENFSIALVEAMSSGAAVLTSDAGGCPEVVGDAALLTPFGDVNATREKLKRLIEDETLRKELGKKALTRVEQFSWPTVTRRYEEVFEKYK